GEDSENTITGATPGEMMILNNVKEVGQFKVADPSTFLEPMRVFIRAMATITATPLHYFEPTGNVPSGEALRVAEAPLVKKVRTRQLSFGATWREVFTFILESAGFKEDVQVHWKPVETFDTKEAMEIAYKKIQIGIPLAQVAAEMGYDAAIVANWIAENNAQNVQAGSDIPGDENNQDLNPDADATTAVPDGSKAAA
ncbi:hypothetical protein, partial [Streptomyces sp. C1-2]|uniref:hypothetical protein n=1 Tax=Streptomyces sp. C1-2 TaxID=2720022 RepID=UPI0016BD3748